MASARVQALLDKYKNVLDPNIQSTPAELAAFERERSALIDSWNKQSAINRGEPGYDPSFDPFEMVPLTHDIYQNKNVVNEHGLPTDSDFASDKWQPYEQDRLFREAQESQKARNAENLEYEIAEFSRKNPGLDPATAKHAYFASIGRQDINQQRLAESNAALIEAAKRRQANGMGGKIAGLARGVVLAGLGAAASGALGTAAIPGVAPASAATSAGTAAGGFAVKPALSGALSGAVNGLASGEGLPGALKGAAIEGLTSGFGPSLSNGLKLSETASKTFTGALSGAGKALASGEGAKGVLTSAALGGAGGYASGGGLGAIAGAPVSDTIYGPTQGSGLIGSVTRALPSLSTALSGGGARIGSYARPIAAAVGGYNTYKANEDMERQLLEAQGRTEEALSPFTESGAAANQQLSERLQRGFQPGDLTQTPGYRDKLDKGQAQLNRGLAAGGSLFSGKAIKATQAMNQGMADATFNEAYKNWLTENEQLFAQTAQGMGAAGGMAQAATNKGNIQGNATVNGSNILNNSLSAVLSGRGKLKDERRYL